MLTIAKVGVAHVNQDVEAMIRRWIDLDRIEPFLGRSWPGPVSAFLTWPIGYRKWPPPLKLNRIYWPMGASRWACGAFVVDNSQGNAKAIHDAAFGEDGNQVNGVDILMDSPSAVTGESPEAVTFKNMYVMAMIPLYRLVLDDTNASVRPMYLVIVADQRIYWWDIPTPDFSITEIAAVSWSFLISQCSSAIGIPSISTSTISTKYLQPSRDINLTNEPIAPVLDAIAANIGMRVVVDYDGTVTMSNFSDALHAYSQDQKSNPSRSSRRLAGGGRFLDVL